MYQAKLASKNIEIDNFIKRKRRLIKEKEDKLSIKLAIHQKEAEEKALQFSKQDLNGKDYHFERDGSVTIINEVKAERLPPQIKEVLKN